MKTVQLAVILQRFVFRLDEPKDKESPRSQ